MKDVPDAIRALRDAARVLDTSPEFQERQVAISYLRAAQFLSDRLKLENPTAYDRMIKRRRRA